jgi:hypothetical protein
MADTEKAIKLTGGAVLDFQSLKRTGRKSRGNSRKRQSGGAEPSISKTDEGAAPLPAPPPPPSVHSAANAKPVVSGVAPEQPGPTSLVPPQNGGKKPKLVLDPSKKKQTHLIPSKGSKPKSTATRKNGKKIRVSLAGLGKRMTRHKSIQKEAKQVKLEDIKKALVDAKLVKADTKAPESMLRQMYADYQTLKNKAL